MSCVSSPIRRCFAGRSRFDRSGEGRLDIMEQRRLVRFDKPQIMAAGIQDLLGQIALAEDGITGDEAPLEKEGLEQSEGRLVLVGLLSLP